VPTPSGSSGRSAAAALSPTGAKGVQPRSVGPPDWRTTTTAVMPTGESGPLQRASGQAPLLCRGDDRPDWLRQPGGRACRNSRVGSQAAKLTAGATGQGFWADGGHRWRHSKALSSPIWQAAPHSPPSRGAVRRLSFKDWGANKRSSGWPRLRQCAAGPELTPPGKGMAGSTTNQRRRPAVAWAQPPRPMALVRQALPPPGADRGGRRGSGRRCAHHSPQSRPAPLQQHPGQGGSLAGAGDQPEPASR